jgi:starch synthase
MQVMLTIHNLENTGEVRQDEFAATGCWGEQFASIDKALDERTLGHNPERLNLMKGGIVYSNAVTTVSPTYAREVASGGAAGFLRPIFEQPEVAAKFSGILNGIDAEVRCQEAAQKLPRSCQESAKKLPRICPEAA